MLPNYSRVRLLTDRFSPDGLKYGDVGYIIETYDNDAYEVEFSDDKGITIAQIVAHDSELEVCEPVHRRSHLFPKR